MSLSELVAPLLGRWLLGWFFLSEAWFMARGWDRTILDMTVKGIPMAPLLLAVALLVMFLGGLSLVLGFHTRHGAMLLFAFVLISSVAMNAFWRAHGPALSMEYEIFARNLAIAGGLLFIVGVGPGRFAIDNTG